MKQYPRIIAVGIFIFVTSLFFVVFLNPQKQTSVSAPVVMSQDMKKDLIVLDTLREGDSVSSPLHITGKARGTWYFEASFPVVFLDSQGKEIGNGIATAVGDWMTTDFVPFIVDVAFVSQNATSGTLIFKKDNPSGDKIRDDQLVIPVVFTSL